jgi:hypothetical protein
MLIYQDTLGVQHGSPRVPHHLEGCPILCERQCDSGDLIGLGGGIDGPLFLQPPASPRWEHISGNWKVMLIGAYVPEIFLRPRLDIPGAHRVKDTLGRIWHAPAILDPRGAVLLDVPLKRIDGVFKRTPRPDQARLIETAQAARAEIESGRIGSVDANVLADWCARLHAGIYWPGIEEFGALSLYDDRLIMHTLLASAGFPKA